jgi:hypothetical protein
VEISLKLLSLPAALASSGDLISAALRFTAPAALDASAPACFAASPAFFPTSAAAAPMLRICVCASANPALRPDVSALKR